jgi:hypothetical protein
MERFELTVIAQGSQSVRVALLEIALLCATVLSLAVALWALRRSERRQGAPANSISLRLRTRSKLSSTRAAT